MMSRYYECVGCFGVVLPPIKQCANGHLICIACRYRVPYCPMCRDYEEPEVSNLALDRLAEFIEFPCQYSVYGCNMSIMFPKKAEHEAVCEFQRFVCPALVSSCHWYGRLSDVVQHLKDSHPSIPILEGEDIIFSCTQINAPNAIEWVMVQSCFGRHFVLVMKKVEEHYYAVPLLIGTKEEAKKFKYRIEIRKPRQGFGCRGTVHSIEEGMLNVIERRCCLDLVKFQMEPYIQYGNLPLHVWIGIPEEEEFMVDDSEGWETMEDTENDNSEDGTSDDNTSDNGNNDTDYYESGVENNDGASDDNSEVTEDDGDEDEQADSDIGDEPGSIVALVQGIPRN